MTEEQLKDVNKALNNIGIENVQNIIIINNRATNGDIVKSMFPDAQIDYHEKSDLVDSYVTVFIKDCDTCQDYSYDWWISPYKQKGESNG